MPYCHTKYIYWSSIFVTALVSIITKCCPIFSHLMPGLFHRAILMSGSSFSSWSLVEDPVHYAVKVANSLNCTVPTNMMKNHQDIVKCLREKPLSDLMSVDVKAPSFLTAMGPSRDGVLIPSDFGTSSIHIRFIKFSSSFPVVCWYFLWSIAF